MTESIGTLQYGPYTMGVRYDLPAEGHPIIGINGNRAVASLAAMEGCRLTQSGKVEKALGTKSYQTASALAGTPTETGLFEFLKDSSNTYVVKVAGSKVYYYNSGWTDITGSLTITASDDNTWEFANANGTLVACNGVDAPWKWTGSGNASVLDLDSRFTVPKHVAYWNNRLFFGNEGTNADRVWRSALGDIETWGASDYYQLGFDCTGLKPLSGQVLGMHTLEGIQTLTPTGNSVVPYQQVPVTNEGSPSGRALPVWRGLQFLPLDDGIYMWDGSKDLVKVSHALDGDYWPNINTARLSQCFALHYPDKNEIWWWLPYGTGQTNMNHIMVMSTRLRYTDPFTGTQEFAWYGPLTGATTTFERNCAALIDGKPHAGTFGGKVLDHRPAGVYNHESAAYTSYWKSGAPAAIHAASDVHWLWLKTYYDGLGSYDMAFAQESQGVGLNTGTLTMTGSGGEFGDNFGELTFGYDGEVSQDLDLAGYDPHSSIKFTNNNADEPFRFSRAYAQYEPIGPVRKTSTGT